MHAFRFGDFEFDAQTFELRRSGSTVRLQQQPARVFAFLLNHRGSLVTREQIRVAIWGDDTFVDFEQGLNYCISQIRLALNDQAEKPLYIETVPRLGYRFIASAETVTAEATQAAPGQTAREIAVDLPDLSTGETIATTSAGPTKVRTGRQAQ